MKKVFYLLSLTALSIVFITLSAKGQPWLMSMSIDSAESFPAVKQAFDNYWSDKQPEKGSGWKQFKRWEYFWEQRLFPDGDMPDAKQIHSEFERWRDKKGTDGLQADLPVWRELGPKTIPTNRLSYKSSGMGRINCVRFHPTQTNIIFAGAASGGIWRSTNSGAAWEPIPMTEFLSLGITDIAISPSNPNIIYASTGDANGSNMTRGYSIGIIKSTDGGATWKLTGRVRELKDTELATSIIIHPSNPNIVLAGTNRGVIKSSDGGENWTIKQTNKYFRHIIQLPGAPDILIAATYNAGGNAEIFKSTDAGENWELKRAFSAANRIVLSAAPSNGNIVYAVMSRTSSNSFYGFYASTDGGDNWNMQSDSPNILSIMQDGSGTWGQGHYDLALAVAPNDPNMVFVGGIHIWKSTNGGRFWELMTHWTGSYGKPFVHADQHDLTFRPGSAELFSGNDGGIHKSGDYGKTWVDISSGLAITQFYKFGVSRTDPSMVVGGTQDNGSHMFKNGNWYHILGGDGMECVVDYSNENIIYSENYYGALNRSTNGGNSFSAIINTTYTKENADWVAPFIQHPTEPNTILIGFANVWRTTNRGDAWQKISDFGSTTPLTHLAVSAKDPKTIYAVRRNQIFRSKDNGLTWAQFHSFQNNVTYMAINPDDPDHFFVSLSGYRAGEKVYEYKNEQWLNISGSLPNVPVSCIVHQQNTHYRLFIATDIGVFVREKDADDWALFNRGMPNIVITELEFHYGSGKLYAATFARGIWETDIVSCDVQKPTLSLTGDIAICSGDSVIIGVNEQFPFYRWSNGSTKRQIVVKSYGSFSVVVEDSLGCSAISETVNVNVKPVPPLVIRSSSGEFALCDGDSLTLLGPSVGYTVYNWSNGATSRNIVITKPGGYRLTGTTSQDCSASDSVYIVGKPLPEKPVITRSGNKLISTPAVSYKWYRNGWELSNSNTQAYTLLQPGEYTVRITGENDCSALSDPFDVETSVDEPKSETFSIRLSPNPSSGKFIIELYSDIDCLADISAVNLLGVEVRTYQNISLNKTAIIEADFGDLPDGIYFVKLNIGEYSIVKMFVLSK